MSLKRNLLLASNDLYDISPEKLNLKENKGYVIAMIIRKHFFKPTSLALIPEIPAGIASSKGKLQFNTSGEPKHATPIHFKSFAFTSA